MPYSGDEPSLSGAQPRRRSSKKNAPALSGEAGLLHLVRLLDDPDENVQWRARNALAEQGDMRVLDTLLRILKTPGHPYRVARELALIGRPALPHVIQALDSTEQSVQHEAAIALDWMLRHYPDWQDELWPHLLKALQDTDSPDAANALSHYGSAAIPYLGAALERPIPDLQLKAAQALAQIGEEAIPVLRRAFCTDDEESRITYCQHLAFIDSIEAVLELLELIQSDPVSRVRSYALGMLDGLNNSLKCLDGSFLVELYHSLLDDPAEHLRAAALHHIGNFNDPAYLPMFIEAAQSESANMKIAAASVLGKGKYPEALPLLLGMLDHEDGIVRWKALWGLGDLGDRSVTPRICEIAVNRPEDSLPAVHALQKLVDPASIPALITIMNGNYGDAVRFAIRTLAAIGDPIAVPALIEAIDDPDRRPYAADALAAIDDPRITPALIERAQSDDLSLASYVMSALGSRRDPGAVPALTHILHYKKSGHAGYAWHALKQIATPEALAAIAPFEDDDD